MVRARRGAPIYEMSNDSRPRWGRNHWTEERKQAKGGLISQELNKKAWIPAFARMTFIEWPSSPPTPFIQRAVKPSPSGRGYEAPVASLKS